MDNSTIAGEFNQFPENGHLNKIETCINLIKYSEKRTVVVKIFVTNVATKQNFGFACWY